MTEPTGPTGAGAGGPTRRRAVALAGHQGDVGSAIDALSDPDPAVRATALGALERLGTLGRDTLEAALADPGPVVRRRAAELAARHRDVSLLVVLDDPDPGVVEAAAFAARTGVRGIRRSSAA